MKISEKQLCVDLRPQIIAAECSSCSKIGERILHIRGKCVMVDRDLAELYKVPTKVLNKLSNATLNDSLRGFVSH